MAERRKEEEGEEGARLWGSVGLYRPTSSWVRNGATGGGRFGSRAHDGEWVELPAARRMAGGVVAAWGAAWDACAREEMPRGGPGGAERLPWVHLAVDARWTKSTGGVRRAARTEQPGEREMEIRA